MDRLHKVYAIKRDSSKRIHVIRKETDKNSNDMTSRSHMAWRLDENWKSRSKKREARMGNRETTTRICQKCGENLTYDPSDENYKDIIKNARRKLETPMAAAMPCNRALSKASIRETVVPNTQKSQSVWSKDNIQLYYWSTWIHETKNRVNGITICSPDNSSLKKDQERQGFTFSSGSCSWPDEECEQILS